MTAIDDNRKARTLDRIAAMLGANEEWDSAADYLEDIATEINRCAAYPHRVSDQGATALTFWRATADGLGIEHDGEPEDEDEPEDEPDDIVALTEQVRDREGDWLIALDILAEYAQKRVDDERD